MIVKSRHSSFRSGCKILKLFYSLITYYINIVICICGVNKFIKRKKKQGNNHHSSDGFYYVHISPFCYSSSKSFPQKINFIKYNIHNDVVLRTRKKIILFTEFRVRIRVLYIYNFAEEIII